MASTALPSTAASPNTGRRLRLVAAATVVLLLAVVAGAYALVHQRRLSEREARIDAQVAQLFQARLGVKAICHLSPVAFLSDAELDAIESRLRRLASAEQTMTLACGLSTLARGHALSGHYRHADRLSGEATGLLHRAELDNLAVAATAVSLSNLQARYAPAEQIARAELRREHDTLDSVGRLDRLRLQIELARAQWGLADDDGATQTLESALTQARLLVPPDAALIAELLTQRGEWRGRRFDFAGAERDLDQAIAMSRGSAQGDNARYHLVRMLSYTEQTDRALTEAERLLADRSRHAGERHPDTGRAWIALAEALYGTGQFRNSALALAQGKAIVLSSFGAHHPEYAEVLRLQSRLDALHGRHREAISHARRAVWICESAFGPTHETSLRMRFNLAMKLAFGPDSVWDSDHFREGLSILEELVQTGSEADIPTPYEEAALAAALVLRAPEREQARAERLLRDAQAEAHRYLPERSASRTSIDYALAWALYRSGHQAQADALFERYVATADHRAESLTRHLLVQDLLKMRAWYAMSTCRRDDALESLRQAREQAGRYLPDELPHARKAGATIAEIERHGVLRERFGREGLGLNSPQTTEAKLYFEASAHSQACFKGWLAKR